MHILKFNQGDHKLYLWQEKSLHDTIPAPCWMFSLRAPRLENDSSVYHKDTNNDLPISGEWLLPWLRRSMSGLLKALRKPAKMNPFNHPLIFPKCASPACLCLPLPPCGTGSELYGSHLKLTRLRNTLTKTSMNTVSSY